MVEILLEHPVAAPFSFYALEIVTIQKDLFVCKRKAQTSSNQFSPFFSDPFDSSSSSRSRSAYPMVRNSKSVYYMPNATGPPTRTPSRTPGERGRGRSNSSGCFLDSLETPTPPPPPTSTFSNSTLKHFRAPKPKYKYNGYLPKSEVTDFTTAGPASPTMSTPVPTPPPPPPPSKHFGLAFKKPLHHML